MSRGRGSFRGGRGRGFFGGNLPMGLTYADVQNLSRDEDPMYPPLDPLPVLVELTEEERTICNYQQGFSERLRKSPYYVVEKVKSTELPRYSDKYMTSVKSHPSLRKSEFNSEFFPTDVFDAYFNPKIKRKGEVGQKKLKKMNLDDVVADDEAKESSDKEESVNGSQNASDYDVDEEYDNDYADNYFDNGEEDALDDIVGGGGDDGGGGGDYD